MATTPVPEMSTLSFTRKYNLVFSDKYCLLDDTSASCRSEDESFGNRSPITSNVGIS